MGSEIALLASSQMMLMLLVQVPHFELQRFQYLNLKDVYCLFIRGLELGSFTIGSALSAVFIRLLCHLHHHKMAAKAPSITSYK